MYARCFWSKWNSKSTDTSDFALIALRGQWASFWQDYSANQATPPKYHRHYRWDTKSLVLGINFLLAGCTLRSVSLRGLDDVVRWNVLESGKTSQRRCFHWDSATEAKCYNWSTLCKSRSCPLTSNCIFKNIILGLQGQLLLYVTDNNDHDVGGDYDWDQFDKGSKTVQNSF